MKKLLALTLAVMMLFTLVACATEEATESSAPAASSTPATESSAAPESSEEAPESSEEPAPESSEEPAPESSEEESSEEPEPEEPVENPYEELEIGKATTAPVVDGKVEDDEYATVIEYDELMTGERREGVYYGVHAPSGKITGALASAACGWGLELGRYVDNLQAGQTQPESAVVSIRIMFALIPAVFLLICVPLLLKYPITKASHAEVMKKLQERRAAKNEEKVETK